MLWLNGGVNGSGDLLGKVNEFEGLVAAEEEQKAQEKAALAAASTATASDKSDSDSSDSETGAKEEENITGVTSPVNIVVVPSDATEGAASKADEQETPSASAPESTPAPVKDTPHINGHSTSAEKAVLETDAPKAVTNGDHAAKPEVLTS